ncbi:MAG: threonine synthase [Gammaproteobacteria bacterium]|nr:threonine synthase [Gammaproteobacteria bacterium]
MDYISTRGSAPTLNFKQATLTGLAEDGGLYIPQLWPSLSLDEIRKLRNLDYPTLAVEIIHLFTGDCVDKSTLKTLSDRAYGNFHHDAIAPLKQLDSNLFFLELFHGPTLAFKDFALQLLGQLFDHFLQQDNAKCTIIGATSGDTGSAAIEGVRGLSAVELFMLHPKGRVSEVQRRQMTTIADANIHNLAVAGTFDDCQSMVKAMFNDSDFRKKHSLSAVNSINWARIAAQVVYYFWAALSLGAPDRSVSFSVPTGNFGNILAAYIAKKIGLPIDRLIIGSNRNDILTRFFETGSMEQTGVHPTLTPSMDIQISSNFERYLFELFGRDHGELNRCMTQFSQKGRFDIDSTTLKKARLDFTAHRFNDDQINQEIQRVYRSTGEIIDPHSVIGVAAANIEETSTSPIIAVGTAHPAKFPDAVKNAIGFEVPLPDYLGDLLEKEEKMVDVENDVEKVKAIVG